MCRDRLQSATLTSINTEWLQPHVMQSCNMRSFLIFPPGVNLVTPQRMKMKLLKFFNGSWTIASHQIFITSSLFFKRQCSRSDGAGVYCCSTCCEPQSEFVTGQFSGDRNRCLKKMQPQTCWFAWDLCYLRTSVFGEIWAVIVGGIFSLKITDVANSHKIKITDALHDYYLRCPCRTDVSTVWPGL